LNRPGLREAEIANAFEQASVETERRKGHRGGIAERGFERCRLRGGRPGCV
jgi:hypothetical protein